MILSRGTMARALALGPWIIVVLLLGLSATRHRATRARKSNVDSRAAAMLARAESTLYAARAISMELVEERYEPDGKLVSRFVSEIDAVRPLRYRKKVEGRWEAGQTKPRQPAKWAEDRFHAVLDGRVLWYLRDSTYVRQPVDSAGGHFFEAGPWSGFLDTTAWHPIEPGEWGRNRLGEAGFRSLTLLGDTVWNGERHTVIEWRYVPNFNLPDDDREHATRFYIARSGLIRRASTTVSGHRSERMLRSVRLDPPIDTSGFTAAPAVGATAQPAPIIALHTRLLKIGTTAPDFTLPASDGRRVRLSELLAERKAVLLFFWNYACRGCRLEFPQLQMMRDSLAGKGFELVPVTLFDGADTVRKFVAHNRIAAPVLIESRSDSSAVYHRYRVGTGTFYLVGRDGRIAYAGPYNRAAFDDALRVLGVR